jgi:CBS domain-containing protein/anti-sigma regulatory factor (Ser/Thr protein kinase)
MNEDNKYCKLTKYIHIFQDLKADEIMTKNVVTLTPDKKLSQAKEMMKIKKVSGIPIVKEDKTLIGIVSIEDIILALESGTIIDKIEKHMSKNVVFVNEQETLSEIVEKFSRYKFGRFPVVDKREKVVGIISKEDILHSILEKFSLIYLHDEKRKSKLNQDRSLITGESLKISEAEFHYNINSTEISAAGEGAAHLKQFLKTQKIEEDITRRIGIATYEAETNVVIHSKSKGDIYCFLKKDRIIVRVIDFGEGIEDLNLAMKEGFSTAEDYVRELGFGAGMGIPNMKRFADKLVILSERKVGTQVEMVFYLY